MGSKNKKLTQDEFIDQVEALNKGYKVVGQYINNRTNVAIECQNHHIWSPKPANLIHKNSGCPYCLGKAVWIGENDMWTTAPEIAKLLLDPNDGYKYSKGSKKKTYFKCPNCGDVSYKNIDMVNRYGFVCQKCSDGISYPNKFGRALLDQLPIKNFECEYSPDWAKPYIYDNYFEYQGNSYILEMDGRMGHGNSKNDYLRKSGLGGKELDNYKDAIAESHNIDVIRIDCKISEYKYIYNNIINSKMNTIFDLSNVNWNFCNEKAQKNIIKEVAEIYKSGIHNTKQIQEIFHIGISSTLKYLQIATNIGWCDYSLKNSLYLRTQKTERPIVTIDYNNNVLNYFRGMSAHIDEIQLAYGIEVNTPNIIKSCKTHKPYKGINFRYADEYVPKEIIDKIKLKDNAEELFFDYIKTEQND